MKHKVFISAILFFVSLGLCSAQQVSKAATKPQQKTNNYHPKQNDLLFLEQYKGLLADFDEAALLNAAKGHGFNQSEILELTISKKIKHINKKLNIAKKITPNKSNSTLSSCDNIGFENGDFSNWIASTADLPGTSWDPCPNPFPSSNYIPGLVQAPNNEQAFTGFCTVGQTDRFTILTDSMRYDSLARDPANGNYIIPYLAPGV